MTIYRSDVCPVCGMACCDVETGSMPCEDGLRIISRQWLQEFGDYMTADRACYLEKMLDSADWLDWWRANITLRKYAALRSYLP